MGIFIGTNCGYTDRARVSEVLLTLSSNRLHVEENFVTLGAQRLSPVTKLGVIGSLKTKDGTQVKFEHIEITRDGAIVAITSGLPLYIKFEPKIKDGKVIGWNCSGKPEKMFPSSCR